MQQMLQSSTLRNPSGKPPYFWAAPLPARNNGRKLTSVSQAVDSHGGSGRPCKVGDAFSSRARLSYNMKHPFWNAHIWSLQSRPSRGKLSLIPAMCHKEMEIVSIKELADGSLHFSFGTSPNSGCPSKVDELSSMNGEHLAPKSVAPSRLPSRFRKQSPIPLAAVGRKRKQLGSAPREEAGDDDVPERIKNADEGVKQSSRPKTSFVKKSPIPGSKRKDVRPQPSVQKVEPATTTLVNSSSENASVLKQQPSEGTSKGRGNRSSGAVSQKSKGKESVKKEEKPERLPSRFVRKSPVPVSAIKQDVRPVPRPDGPVPLPDGHDLTANGAADFSTKQSDKAVVTKSSRPKSSFHRRSPIPSYSRRDLSSIPSAKPQGGSLQEDLAAESLSNEAHRNSAITMPAEFSVVVDVDGGLEGLTDRGETLDSESQPKSPTGSQIDSDLMKYKLSELKSIAKSRGLKGYSRLKKGELIGLLEKMEG